jgi:hypothetical protein
MYDNIRVIGSVKDIPSEAQIKIVESTLDLRLPTSYRNFVTKFGSGLLCDLFSIYIPGAKIDHMDLMAESKLKKVTIMNALKSGFIESEKLGLNNVDVVKSFVPFGNSSNGDILCWDTLHENEGEYPIYFIDNEYTTIFIAAQSLNEFVEEFCLKKIDEIYPIGNGDKWNLPATFKAYSN